MGTGQGTGQVPQLTAEEMESAMACGASLGQIAQSGPCATALEAKQARVAAAAPDVAAMAAAEKSHLGSECCEPVLELLAGEQCLFFKVLQPDLVRRLEEEECNVPDDGMSVGVIIGATVGGCIVILLIVLIVMRARNVSKPSYPEGSTNGASSNGSPVEMVTSNPVTAQASA
jgi:hypothetical protein